LSLAIHEFMHGLVDYAGLFPPAKLVVADAVSEFAEHKASAESGMLGRFIAPANKLAVIARTAAPHLGTGVVWPFSVIVGDRESSQAALASLTGQGLSVKAAVAAGLKVEVLEIPLPADINAGVEVEKFLVELGSELHASGLAGYELFIEVKPGAESDGILASIAAFAGTKKNGVQRVGVKLRCGGLVASAFPSCEDIAGIIFGCRQESLAMKFTAGLHHPLRHFDGEINVMMHGFLNVFGSGLLAHAHGLSASEIATILAETEPAAFKFNETGFAWRHLNVEISTIRTLRSQYLCGFGSCSFTEPRDDLFGLALL